MASENCSNVSFDRVVFLGTSSACPTSTRNTSCIGIRLTSGKCALIDCGEAAQHTILRNKAQTGISLMKIDLIMLTHMHGDHCFGIFGLLGTMSLNGRKNPITVVGPVGIKEMIETVFRCTGTFLSYSVTFVEIPENNSECIPIKVDVDDFNKFTIVAAPLKHRIAAYGYILTEPTKPGSLNVELAKSLGIEGPQFKSLKFGLDVTLSSGITVKSKDVVSDSTPGAKIAILQDTCDSTSALPYCEDLMLLIHEATYDESMKEKAISHGHSTSIMAASFVLELKNPPKNLVLTHFSSRYCPSDDLLPSSVSVNTLLEEAQGHLSDNGNIVTNVVLSADLMVLDRFKGFSGI